MLVSDQARHDMYIRGETQRPAEQEGQALFRLKCNACHAGPLSTSFDFLNNGLDTASEDIGRALISETPDDTGQSKVPSLRNVTLTAPHMHDGRFPSLEALLQHYRFGVKPSPSWRRRSSTTASPASP
ncbi:MAG: hypothetical protein RLY31_3010 [Bacteroidota bacterium]|jgi:cytochrome c peroxidase